MLELFDLILTCSADSDTKDGYNLCVTTENFTFTPEAAGAEAVLRESRAFVRKGRKSCSTV